MKNTKRNLVVRKISEVTALVLFCLSVQTCDFWMNGGNFFNEIQEQVRVASAEEINVYIRYAEQGLGTISPSMATTEKKKVGFKVTSVTDSKYGFHHWAAFKASDLNANNIDSTLYYDDNYKIEWEGKELNVTETELANNISEEEKAAKLVKFYEYRDDMTTVEEIESLPDNNFNTDTGVYIRDSLPDGQMIYIIPICAKRAKIDKKRTNPSTGATGVVRNQRITLAFDKDIDFSSAVKIVENPEAENGPVSTYKVRNPDNPDEYDEYSYTWNKEKIRIVVTNTSDQELSNPYDCFELPVWDESKPRIITISTSSIQENIPPRGATVSITLSNQIEDKDGFTIDPSVEEYYYAVGNSVDSDAPVLTDLTGGRRIYQDEDNITPVQKENAVNNWTEYIGLNTISLSDNQPFADGLQKTNLSEGSTDSALVYDEVNGVDYNNTSLNYWPDSNTINKFFTNRVTDRLNIYVVIKDVVKDEIIANTQDSDIDHFVARSRLLVRADGKTEGVGEIFEYGKTEAKFKDKEGNEYDYNNLRYYSGESDICSSNEYVDANKQAYAGYAFPYKFPSALPDGLIKIEVFAVDATGNSGEKEPFALYVVKDTTPPKLEIEKNKIESSTTTVLTKHLEDGTNESWFNSSTIYDLSVKVRTGSKIFDFIETEDVNSKFQPASMKWVFGTSAAFEVDAWKEIDNISGTPYDMSNLASSIIENGVNGSMSFYAQIADDLFNCSDAALMSIPVYFDDEDPSEAEILSPSPVNSAKVYPEQPGQLKYYTTASSMYLGITAKDSGSYEGTATSSGIKGFLIPKDAKYSEEELKNALKVTDSVLSNVKTQSPVELTAGENANTSMSEHFIYSVDWALNAKGPVKVTVVQDTQGPEITVTDSTTKVYKSDSNYYRDSDDLTDRETEIGQKSALKGLSAGKYYYSNSQSDVPFTVILKDFDYENKGFASGAKDFQIVNKKDNSKSEPNGSGTVINLSEGQYEIVAQDNLGNTTTSTVITVIQDTAAPEITAFTLTDENAENVLPLSEGGVASVNVDTIGASFSIKDTQTGIRKIIFTSPSETLKADYSNAELYADGVKFEAATGTHSGNTFIFKEPLTPGTVHSIKVKNIKLEGEGEINLQSYAADPTGNEGNREAEGAGAKVNCDTVAPVIEEVYFTNGTVQETYFSKKEPEENLVIKFKEKLSGVQKIELTVTNSDNTYASAAFTAECEGMEKAEAVTFSKTTSNLITLGKVNYPANTSGTEMTITMGKVTIETEGTNAHEGTKTLTVILTDAAGNVSTAATAQITYDITGPAIAVDDKSSYEYEAGKYFRTTDEEVTKAATGTNNAVTGLIGEAEKYYYSSSEENIKFKVTLTDDSTTGCKKNLYFYDGKINGQEQADPGYTAGYKSGSEISLGEGTHVIYAKDYLGNITESSVITVVQDKAAPVTEKVTIFGHDINGVEQTTSSTTSAVEVSVKIKDINTALNDTGIRSFTVNGDAKFTAPATIKRTIGNEEPVILTKDVDYIVTDAGNTNKETIIFKKVQTALAEYRFSGVTLYLESGDGTNIIYCNLKDGTGNEAEQKSGQIFCDSIPPALSNAAVVTKDAGKTNNSSTKNEYVDITFTALEKNSGISRIYIVKGNNSASNLPTSATMLSSTSSISGAVSSGTRINTNEYIKFTSPSISQNGQNITISDIHLDEGEKAYTIYIFATDDAGNLSTPVTANVNRDITAPIVNSITIDGISKVVYYEDKALTDSASYWLSQSNVKTENAQSADYVTAKVNFTEVTSGVEYITIGGTAEFQSDKIELSIVASNGTETLLRKDEDYSLNSSKEIHLLSHKSPVLKAADSVTIKISGIKFTNVNTSVPNTISFVLKDFATNTGSTFDTVTSGSLSGIKNIYADSKLPVISAVDVIDRGGDAESGNSTGTTSDKTANTEAYAGYTNENIVNVKITNAAETTESVINSGVKKITVSGGKFTSDTRIRLNDAVLTSGTDYSPISAGGNTVTFTNPLKASYNITLTNIQFESNSEGEKIISANIEDASSWESAVNYDSVILDTTVPVWSTEPFAAPYNANTDYVEKIYPHPNAESASGKTINNEKYFYTSYEGASSFGAIMGIHVTDKYLRSKSDSVYVKESAASINENQVVSEKKVKSDVYNSAEESSTNYSYWIYLEANTSGNKHYVAVMDKAGNISVAKSFYLIKDTTAPAIKPDSEESTERFFRITYTDNCNNNEDGGRWEVFQTADQVENNIAQNSDNAIDDYSEEAYRNVYKASSDDEQHVKIEIKLNGISSSYDDSKFTADHTGIEYYAVNASTNSPVSGSTGAEGSWNKWIPFTENTEILNVYPYMNAPTGAMYLHLKDGTGNVSSVEIRTFEHAADGKHETWFPDNTVELENFFDGTITSFHGQLNGTDSRSEDGYYTSSKDGYLMPHSGNKVNYVNDKAKLTFNIKENASYVSDSTAPGNTNYSLKARIVASANKPSKTEVDKFEPTESSSRDWQYIAATNNTQKTFSLEYPDVTSSSSLWLCVEDRVGNFYTQQLKANGYDKWVYDATPPMVWIRDDSHSHTLSPENINHENFEVLIPRNAGKKAFNKTTGTSSSYDIWVSSTGKIGTASNNPNNGENVTRYFSSNSPQLDYMYFDIDVVEEGSGIKAFAYSSINGYFVDQEGKIIKNSTSAAYVRGDNTNRTYGGSSSDFYWRESSTVNSCVPVGLLNYDGSSDAKEIYLTVRDYVGNAIQFRMGNDLVYHVDDDRPTGYNTDSVLVPQNYYLKSTSGKLELRIAGSVYDQNKKETVKVIIPNNWFGDAYNGSGIYGIALTESESQDYTSVLFNDENENYIEIPYDFYNGKTESVPGTKHYILFDNTGRQAESQKEIKIIHDTEAPVITFELIPEENKKVYDESNSSLKDSAGKLSYSSSNMTDTSAGLSPENPVILFTNGSLTPAIFSTSSDKYEATIVSGTVDETTNEFIPHDSSETATGKLNCKTNTFGEDDKADIGETVINLPENSNFWFYRVSLSDMSGNTKYLYFRIEKDTNGPVLGTISDSDFTGLIGVDASGHVYYNGRANGANGYRGISENADNTWTIINNLPSVNVNVSFTDSTGVAYCKVESAEIRSSTADNIANPLKSETSYTVKLGDLTLDSDGQQIYVAVADKLGNITYAGLKYKNQNKWINDYTAPSDKPDDLSYIHEISNLLYYTTGNTYYNASENNSIAGTYANINFTASSDTSIQGVFDKNGNNKIYKNGDSYKLPSSTTETTTVTNYFVDYAGNINTSKSIERNFIPDSTAPTVTGSGYSCATTDTTYYVKNEALGTEDNPAVYYINGSSEVLNVKYTGLDNASGVKDNYVYIKKASDSNWSTGKTSSEAHSLTSASADGQNVLYNVKVIDNVGNEAIYWVSLITDTTAPTMKLKSITQKDTGNNIWYTTLAAGSEPSRSYDAPTKLFANGESEYYVEFELDVEEGSGVKYSSTTFFYVHQFDSHTSTYSDEAGINYFSSSEANKTFTFTLPCKTGETDKLVIKDNLGNERNYYITEIADTSMGNSASTAGAVIPHLTCSSADDYYTEAVTGTTSTVYSQQGSVTVNLSTNGYTDNYSGFKGFYTQELNASQFKQGFTAVTTLDLSEGNNDVWLYDNVGNKEKFTINLIKDNSAPSLTMSLIEGQTGIYPTTAVLSDEAAVPSVYYIKGVDTTETKGLGVIFNLPAADGGAPYDNIISVNNGATLNSAENFYLQNSGTHNLAKEYSFTVSDKVLNSKTYYVKLVPDNESPVFSEVILDKDIILSTADNASQKISASQNINNLNNNGLTYIVDSEQVNIQGTFSDDSSGVTSNTKSTGFISASGTKTLTVKDLVGNETSFVIKLEKDEGVTSLAVNSASEDFMIYTPTNSSTHYYNSALVTPVSTLQLSAYEVNTDSSATEPAGTSYELPSELDTASKLYFHYTDILGKTGVVQLGSSADDVYICDKTPPFIIEGEAPLAANEYSSSNQYYTDGIVTVEEETGFYKQTLSTKEDEFNVSFITATQWVSDFGSGYKNLTYKNHTYEDPISISSLDTNLEVEIYDNVGNKSIYKLNIFRDTSPVTIKGTIVAQTEYATTEKDYYTTGNSGNSVTVYSKSDSVDVTLESLSNAEDGNVTASSGIRGYSSSSTDFVSITSPYSVSGNSSIYIFNNVGTTAAFTINYVKDDSVPLITAAPVADHIFSDTEKYFVGSEDWDPATSIMTVNTNGAITSVTVALKPVAQVAGEEGENNSGIRGYSSSSTSYEQVDSVEVSTSQSTVYIWDKVGNVTPIYLVLNQVGGEGLTVASLSVTECTTENTYLDTAAGKLWYGSGVTSIRMIVEGVSGGMAPYSITCAPDATSYTISDAVGNTFEYTNELPVTITEDSTAPELSNASSNGYAISDGSITKAVDSVVGKNYKTNYYPVESKMKVPVKEDGCGIAAYGILISGTGDMPDVTPEAWTSITDTDLGSGNNGYKLLSVTLPDSALYHKYIYVAVKDKLGNKASVRLCDPAQTNETWFCPYIKQTGSFNVSSSIKNKVVTLTVTGLSNSAPVKKIYVYAKDKGWSLKDNNNDKDYKFSVTSYTAKQSLCADDMNPTEITVGWDQQKNSRTIEFNASSPYILTSEDPLVINLPFSQDNNKPDKFVVEITDYNNNKITWTQANAYFIGKKKSVGLITETTSSVEAFNTVSSGFAKILNSSQIPEAVNEKAADVIEEVAESAAEVIKTAVASKKPAETPDYRRKTAPAKKAVQKSHSRDFSEETYTELVSQTDLFAFEDTDNFTGRTGNEVKSISIEGDNNNVSYDSEGNVLSKSVVSTKAKVCLIAMNALGILCAVISIILSILRKRK